MTDSPVRPLVSIITVNFNGLEFVQNLYESLRNLTYRPIELILVDNASSDGSVNFVRKHFPEVTIVQNPDNFMFARGNNEGFKIARGDIIGLVNNDVQVAPDFLDHLMSEFTNNPGMAACQPKVLDLNQPDKFEYAGAAGGFIDKYGYPFMRGRLFFTLEQDLGQYDSKIPIFWSTGACFFIRRSVLDQVGLLDEAFQMHMEEIDLCWRMHLHGYQIFCIPAACVWHRGGGTLSAENPKKIYWNFRNNIFLLAKNLGVFNLLRILIFRLFLDWVAALWEIFRGKWANARAIGSAYFWLVTHSGTIREKRQAVQRNRVNSDRKIFELIYPGSVVWEYFGKKRNKFSDLKNIRSLPIL